MASSAGRAKRDREIARQARAAKKRARRQGEGEPGEEGVDEAEESGAAARPAVPQDELLGELARIHAQFDAGDMDFDDFEEAKRSLIEQLDI